MASRGEDYSALRGALAGTGDRATALAIFFHDIALQPHPDQLQDKSVKKSTLQALPQLAVVNRVEVAAQIRVKDFSEPGLERLPNSGKCVMGLAARSKSVRTVLKICLENRLQDHDTSEQFHSEFKTDMNLERLPSGKFATNAFQRVYVRLASG